MRLRTLSLVALTAGFMFVFASAGLCQSEFFNGNEPTISASGYQSISPKSNAGAGIQVGLFGHINAGVGFVKVRRYYGYSGVLELLPFRTHGRFMFSTGLAVSGGGSNRQNGHLAVSIPFYLVVPLSERVSLVARSLPGMWITTGHGSNGGQLTFGGGFTYSWAARILTEIEIGHSTNRWVQQTYIGGSLTYVLRRHE